MPSTARTPDRDALLALATLATSSWPTTLGAPCSASTRRPRAECLAWMSLAGRPPARRPPRLRRPGRVVGHRRVRTGRAHSPDGADDVTVTLLVDRAGATASVLQRGDEREVLPGRPDGVLADACRRALGLPTAPPPWSSLMLWTQTWLDRIVEAEAPERTPGRPACRGRPSPASTRPSTGRGDPVALALDAVGAGRGLALGAACGPSPRWPTCRAPARRPAVAQWMDDGMWARWLIEPPALRPTSCSRPPGPLLSPVVADAVDLVVTAAVDAGGWAIDDCGRWADEARPRAHLSAAHGRSAEGAGLPQGGDPGVVVAEHRGSTSSVCWPTVGAFVGTGSSSSSDLIGDGSCSAPSALARDPRAAGPGTAGRRRASSGVLTGAIGVLCSSPKAIHSARRAGAEDLRAARPAARGCRGRGRRTATRASARTGPAGRRRRRSSSRTPAPTP